MGRYAPRSGAGVATLAGGAPVAGSGRRAGPAASSRRQCASVRGSAPLARALAGDAQPAGGGIEDEVEGVGGAGIEPDFGIPLGPAERGFAEPLPQRLRRQPEQLRGGGGLPAGRGGGDQGGGGRRDGRRWRRRRDRGQAGPAALMARRRRAGPFLRGIGAGAEAGRRSAAAGGGGGAPWAARAPGPGWRSAAGGPAAAARHAPAAAWSAGLGPRRSGASDLGGGGQAATGVSPSISMRPDTWPPSSTDSLRQRAAPMNLAGERMASEPRAVTFRRKCRRSRHPRPGPRRGTRRPARRRVRSPGSFDSRPCPRRPAARPR